MDSEARIPRILLTGKDGQLGFELQRSLAVIGGISALGRLELDLARPAQIRDAVQRLQPDIIVNAAAYTAVDKAESESELAYAINAQAPQVLAEEAKKRGALLVHYSTDYVFDGSKQGAYVESDAPNPLSVYGKSKLAGEQAIRDSGWIHLILRTSWVFGAHGGNFLKTMLRLAKEREGLRIVADQIGAPTPAALISDVTAHLIAAYLRGQAASAAPPFHGGLYHLAASGAVSWHGYACEIVRIARQLGMPLKVKEEDVAAIASRDYPQAAQRPANSRLDSARLRHAFGLVLPDWRDGVAHVLDQLKEAGNTI